MGAARCLATGTVLGIYDAPKGDTAVVTIADEGVFIYNLNNGVCYITVDKVFHVNASHAIALIPSERILLLLT